MDSKKSMQKILPWDNSELKTLLEELISHGTEAAKLDFKTEIETSTPEQKAELLKDITAIANTYDENYHDHGFLIYGIKAKAITGITKTETDTDKFQNTIEQILKTYISPMPQVYVESFETLSGQKWGVIIIPPRNGKPYMFFKDLSCPTNSTRTRKRGEWFVRRGATTDHGLPEDLALITQKQVELLLEPLQESVRTLQSRVTKTEEQYSSALFKLVERALSALPENAGQKNEEGEKLEADISKAIGMDLSARLKQKLRTPKDAIAEDLISEAKAIRDFLYGSNTGLPWAPQLQNQEENKKTIEKLEEKTRGFQVSVATIMLNDSKGVYTDALLRAIKILAKTTEVPNGVQFNKIGEALRYYPLCIILYTIFICGVAENRGDILKQVLEIPLKHHQRVGATSPITNIFFFCYAAKALFNDAFVQRWCEPMGQRIRQVISSTIGEMITEFSEPEYFFRGEFVLALTNIDKCMSDGEGVEHRVPLPGLYLYMSEVHDPITTFLLEYPSWFDTLYKHPVNEILDMFDRNASKMTESGCIALGLHNNFKTRNIYDEAIQKRAKK